MLTTSKLVLVLFKDGRVLRLPLLLYMGACLTGELTAAVHRDGELV